MANSGKNKGLEKQLTLIMDGGMKYKGEIKAQVPDGLGKLVWENGDFYEGQFKNGKRHGTGKRINADAAILVHACVGGTGAMVVALAKIAGVKTIYGTCSEKNIAAAEQMGIKGVCVRER